MSTNDSPLVMVRRLEFLLILVLVLLLGFGIGVWFGFDLWGGK